MGTDMQHTPLTYALAGVQALATIHPAFAYAGHAAVYTTLMIRGQLTTTRAEQPPYNGGQQ